MRRYFISLAYNGSAYHGWQIQPNAASVQEEIELALSKLHGNQKIEVVGCGRTDAGVHASQYVMHIHVEEGFDFDLITSIYTTKTGNIYYFVYDQGYLPLDGDYYALVKRES